MTRDSNSDSLINPDSDFGCLPHISPKMLWIHYLVAVRHFAECRDNQRNAVWEMLINLLKSPIPQWWRKWKSDPESVSGTGSPPKVKHFFRLVGAQSWQQVSVKSADNAGSNAVLSVVINYRSLHCTISMFSSAGLWIHHDVQLFVVS